MINNTKSLRFPKWREREREENTKKTKPQRVRDEREKEETRVSLADVSVSFFPHFKIKKLREKKKSWVLFPSVLRCAVKKKKRGGGGTVGAEQRQLLRLH